MKRVLIAVACFVLGQVGYCAIELRCRLEGDANFYKVGGTSSDD